MPSNNAKLQKIIDDSDIAALTQVAAADLFSFQEDRYKNAFLYAVRNSTFLTVITIYKSISIDHGKKKGDGYCYRFVGTYSIVTCCKA